LIDSYQGTMDHIQINKTLNNCANFEVIPGIEITHMIKNGAVLNVSCEATKINLGKEIW